MERCNGKMGYLAAIPMLIKRLREAAANGGGATELRCGQSRKSSTGKNKYQLQKLSMANCKNK